MWRFFPGSIRECLKSRYSQKIQPVQPRNQICDFSKKLTVYNAEGNNGHFEEQKGSDAKGHKRKTYETNYCNILQRNLIGALGWSGILIVGWYLSNPNRFGVRTWIDKNSHHSGEKYVNPARILVRCVLAQPLNHILPAAKQITPKEKTSEPGSQFIDGSLDEAVDNFAQAQGSVENRLGVELARRHFYQDAAFLFQRAADRGHPTAAFNLALCHELGLGTKQDFQKAAELYEVASLGGHATATYNLGVFYVHGWGGKKADRAQAKQLFVSAAKLGQVDAQKVLGMSDKKLQQKAEHTPVLCKSESSSISQLVKDSVYKYTSLLEG